MMVRETGFENVPTPDAEGARDLHLRRSDPETGPAAERRGKPRHAGDLLSRLRNWWRGPDELDPFATYDRDEWGRPEKPL
jgi:hypothetical protein